MSKLNFAVSELSHHASVLVSLRKCDRDIFVNRLKTKALAEVSFWLSYFWLPKAENLFRSAASSTRLLSRRKGAVKPSKNFGAPEAQIFPYAMSRKGIARARATLRMHPAETYAQQLGALFSREDFVILR
jgi:hypothetical protein